MKKIAALALLAVAAGADHHGSSRDIPATAAAAGSFETLVKALKAADLVGALQGEGPFTVFAPTDEAFARVPADALAALLQDKEALRGVLLRHVVAGRVTAKQALVAGEAKTLGKATIGIDLVKGRLQVDGANVVATDIAATNGVIHVIDQVLLPPAKAPADARGVLLLAIDRGVPLYNSGNEAACAHVYEVAAAGALLDPALTKKERALLEKGLRNARAEKDVAERAWILRRAFDRLLDNAKKSTKAGFAPVVEAPLPKGFPGPGPLGEVVVKTYPGYRAATADGANPFWKLFRHIKTNDIAMTAPVEMTMKGQGGALRQKDMAFLYERPDQGEAGGAGAVEVVDRKPLRVLSIGVRGPMNDDKVAEARRAIERTLDQSGFRRAGDWRLMGYNSPMVPAERRFWELQLPVEESPAQG